MSEPIRSMAGLVEALRQRRDELDVSNETIDAIAGLPERYAAKLLAPRAPRNMSYNSLGLILGALGIGLQVVEDQEQAAKVRGRWQKRKPQGPRYRSEQAYRPSIVIDPQESLQKQGYEALRLRMKQLSKLGSSKGGKSRAKRLGKRARKRIASTAARKRWERVNAETGHASPDAKTANCL